MLLSDNDVAFTGKHFGFEVLFERNLHLLGIRLINSRPYHPQTNGKNERAHQTSQKWLDKHLAATNLRELQTLLDDYREKYNHRPHQALNGQTPDQRRISGLRQPQVEGTQTPEPSIRAITTRVDHNGNIALCATRVALGKTFAGHLVTTFVQANHLIVFFGNEVLRELDIEPGRNHHPLKIKQTTRPARSIPPADH